MAQTLTDQDVDDPFQVGSLLDQVNDPIGQVTADGAYDGDPTYQTIAAHGRSSTRVVSSIGSPRPSWLPTASITSG